MFTPRDVVSGSGATVGWSVLYFPPSCGKKVLAAACRTAVAGGRQQ